MYYAFLNVSGTWDLLDALYPDPVERDLAMT